MKSWVLAGALTAALVAQPAMAADFGGDDEEYPAPRYGYKTPAPPPSYHRDDDDDDDRYRRYARPRVEPRAEMYRYGSRTCATSDEVRYRLTRFGWRDFHGGEQHGNVVTLRARRPLGRLFELTLDRCTGSIVARRPLEPGFFRRFAERHRPYYQRDYDHRRWTWPRY
jgi:hypothetical protein